MNRLVTRPPLDLVRHVLSERGERCPVCRRPVDRDAPQVRVRGARFHADCAGYRPHDRRAA